MGYSKSQFLSLSFALLLSITANASAQHIPKVIYGEDDRYEVEDYPDRVFKDHSKSVAGMVKGYKLAEDPEDPKLLRFGKIQAQRSRALCKDEKYSDQYTLPICSGFLVDDDILITAAHCIADVTDCKRKKWVFDYVKGTEKLQKKNVYGCKEILLREEHESKYKVKDYAVIRLDRKVEDREPLKLRKLGFPKLGTDLVVIGHPSGLPMKISDGASVKWGMNEEERINVLGTLFKRRYYFKANLDTFSGNSGSPVFNMKTEKVEGLLIQGAEDYEWDEDNKCMRVSKKSNKAFEVEEMVFRITKIKGLKKLLKKESKK
ncbi:MAG: trypsin-like peptidase domain-containing protein [Bacteriovoracaceae bacterium]|nr:trypsin-like peptidase domain-containing protein [Bacteriovoracaceae bacterium]